MLERGPCCRVVSAHGAKVTLDEYPWLKWMLAGSAAVAFLVYYVVTVVLSLRPDAPPRHRPLDRRSPELLLAYRATVLAALDDASPGR